MESSHGSNGYYRFGRHLGHIPPYYYDALQVATRKGDVHVAKLLLQVEDINPNHECHRRGTHPLIVAAQMAIDGPVGIAPCCQEYQSKCLKIYSLPSATALGLQVGYTSIVKQCAQLEMAPYHINTLGFNDP